MYDATASAHADDASDSSCLDWPADAISDLDERCEQQRDEAWAAIDREVGT